MKFFIYLYIYIFLGISGFASDNKVYKFVKTPQIVDSRTQVVVTVKSNGKVKDVIYQKQSNSDNIATFSTQSSSKKGVMLSFGKGYKVDTEYLENKYNIRFVQKLGISFYLFDNISNYDDTQLIKNMISKESNIKTIRPNWSEKMTLY